MAHPNIIIITADGLRWDGMGCAGDPDILTPNMDALAAHGLRFSSVVSPFPEHAAGAHAFLTGDAPREFSPGHGHAAVPSTGLRLPEALREAGYTTFAAGALDLSGAAQAEAFDQASGMDGPGLEDSHADRPAGGNRKAPGAAAEARHPTTQVGNRAVRICQTASEPFFLWVSFPRPRPPFDPPAPWSRMYPPGRLRRESPDCGGAPEASRPGGETLAAYYGCISQVDRQLGRILATLTARGRTNNLIALTAGYGLPVAEAAFKCTHVELLPDALIRVPLLFAGYASQRKGAVEPALAGLGDLVSTLWEIVQLPGASPAGGRSFARQLVESGAIHRQAVISSGRTGRVCLRTPRYKWVSGGPEGAGALFDLQADPHELHNLEAAQQSLAIRKMLLGVSQREALYAP